MADDQQLDNLINLLYEAVLEPNRWREALGLCGQYAGAVDAQLFTLEKHPKSLVSSLLAGTAFSFAAEADFINHYLAIDPRPQLLDGGLGEWRYCHQFNNQDFVNRNAFYQDFLIPNGARYVMAGCIDKSEESYHVLALLRAVGQQPFTQTDQSAAEHFRSHLQRALRLQRHTQHLQTKAELGALAIDALAMPVLIVDQKGAIRHLNKDAERFLADKQAGLDCKMGLLTAMGAANKNTLLALIASASSYPAMGGGMLLQGNDGSCQVFVTPLPAASVFVHDWQSPLALVLVLESGKNLSTLQLLGSLYDLSPAELRVASALLNGKSPEYYAHDAKVSLNTVRTQLKSLFRKTGTSRQSELVALLSQLPQLHPVTQ
jgi:DNA-binding CsgD family transcriptional regulator